jgi:hypothetical protein
MERVNHAVEAIRLIDQTLLEEELVLASLKAAVGSGYSSEEVDAELYDWRTYATH